MRRAGRLVAAGAMAVALGSPVAAGGAHAEAPGNDPRYRHHERYQGDHYDYNEHRGSDPYTEDGPYDGYYHCRRYESPNHAETWCDHYYGRRASYRHLR